MPTENAPGFLACTIVAQNYLAHARVLARSFTAHHPGSTLTVLITDDPQRSTVSSAEPFSVVHLDEIVPTDELSHLVMIYDVKELATAVKPLLLRWALIQGAPVAMYLDPDIEVFDSLSEIADLAAEHSIVLNPHTTSPMESDGCRPSEADILASGVYNLGFLAVSADAGEFLEWWWQRLRRNCLVDPSRMLFVDQRWMDFVPGYFRHTILRDPGVNVAYWNLHSREVARTTDRYEVEGRPLRFFHFSGFSPDSPWILTTHFGSNRVLLSQHPVLQGLCLEYAEKLRNQGFAELAGVPYGWARLPSGMELTPTLRALYRQTLLRHEAGQGPPPPDAFNASRSDEFLAWLNEPVAGRVPLQLSRFLFHIYENRPDVRAGCPGAAKFLHWIREHGVDEHRIDTRLLPPTEEYGAVQAEEQRFGANVVGYLRAELGVGEAGRLVVAALSAAGVPLATHTFAETVSRQEHSFVETQADDEPYSVNIICVNADQTESFATHAGEDFFDGRYSVGLWFWEVEEFPDAYRRALDVIDEVWAASPFVAEALSSATSKPVTTVALPVLSPPTVDVDRRRLGLPGGYLFLYVYDFMSVFERKNPLGLLEAFSRAFAPGEGPTLVLKSVNGGRCRNELERLRFAAAGRPDVVIWDDYVSAADRQALMAACDCYVSLHRSEGFGLTMAEAMALGKPVIATAYSGNMSFMRADDSYLVDYSLVPIPPGCDPYPVSARWAEPDLDQAASYMRLVVADPEAAAARGRAARDRILIERSPEAAGKQMHQRLLEIEEIRFRQVVDSELSGQVPPPGAKKAWRTTIFRRVSPALERLRWARPRHGPATRETPDQSRLEQERLSLQLEHFLRQVQDLAQHVTGLLGLRARAENLEHRTAVVERGLTDLRRGLLVVPYMSDPNELVTTDPWGRTTVGFERANQANEGELYRGFEDIFRGSQEFIRERQRVYLELLGDRSPVLDVGCGRGELLDLFADAGVEARGVDLDAGMVDACVGKGHKVEFADCNDYLSTQPDGHFGAIISAQFIEHIPYEALLRFVELSHRKLAPGGLFIAETVNPHALHAFKTFWVDLSHEKPIFPEVAAAICKLAGFERGYVFYPNGGDDPAVNMWSQGEYAIVCER